eukprot:m.274327 g.274327  ORF g.274327 m.274327 type:complete len:212 (+) comp69021_c0_seq1:308-943(+)
MSAIAASRTGAKTVAVVTPYHHVGGMTTGGIMHADSANTSTIAGLTLEYFSRVLAQYPPAPPPPSPPNRYGCLASMCIPLDDPTGGSPDPKCGGACPQLASNQWLAVRKLSELSKDNRTLTVHLPAGQQTSYLKKSEKLAKFLPPSMIKEIFQGQTFPLVAPASIVDDTYFLVNLVKNTSGSDDDHVFGDDKNGEHSKNNEYDNNNDNDVT